MRFKRGARRLIMGLERITRQQAIIGTFSSATVQIVE